eukprot:4078953-Prorocentrum_lima.AAC.1
MCIRDRTNGANDVYAVAAFASWQMELGHARMILQTDGEPAISALATALRDKVIAEGLAEQV